MKSHELLVARERLGMTQPELCAALEMTGADPVRTLRRWESGRIAVPGPVAVAVKLLLKRRRKRRITPDSA